MFTFNTFNCHLGWSTLPYFPGTSVLELIFWDPPGSNNDLLFLPYISLTIKKAKFKLYIVPGWRYLLGYNRLSHLIFHTLFPDHRRCYNRSITELSLQTNFYGDQPVPLCYINALYKNSLYHSNWGWYRLGTDRTENSLFPYCCERCLHSRF
jgi:hypothetical protein